VEVVACCEAVSLRLIEVTACWVELASRKFLAETSSERTSAKWAVIFSATASAREEEILSVVSSLIRKATERMVATVSLGIFDMREAVRRI